MVDFELEFPEDCCRECGGGIDRDHPTTCSACRYELTTGRNYERDVDQAQRKGLTLAQFHHARINKLYSQIR